MRFLRWTILLVLILSATAAAAWLWSSDAMTKRRLRRMTLPQLEKLWAEQKREDPLLYAELGKRLNQARRYADAAAVLRSAVLMKSDTAELYAELGLALSRSGQPVEAEVMCRRALELKKDMPLAHFVLGNLYGKAKLWEHAIREFETTLRLEPENDEARYWLAQCYGVSYQQDKKLAIVEKLVKEHPQVAKYHQSLGASYLYYGRLDEAERHLQTALKLDPKDLDTRLFYGRALAEKADSPQRFQQAERELRAVLNTAPQSVDAHAALGVLHFRQGRFARAAEELERATKLGNYEEKTLFFLGQSYLRLGRLPDGKKTLERYQRVSDQSRTIQHLENRILNAPDDLPARLRLAQLYHATGQFGRARFQLQEILQRQPDHKEAQQKLTQWERSSPSQ
jgi:tetratricopeptide (TPR) repeat protein